MTSPMLVFLHPHAGTGGAEEVLVAIVRGLAGDFPVVVVLLSHGALEERLREAGAEVIVHRLPGRWTIPLYPFAARAIARKLEGRRVGLVHANQTKAAVLGIPLARRVGVPLVWMKHGHDFNRAAPRFLGPRCDHLICVSEAVAATFPPRLRDRITVVYPGVEPPAEVSVIGEQPVVLSVGTLIPTKGHDTLIRAVALLRDREVDARLEVAGSEHRVAPGHRAQLERLIAELGVGERVELLGWRDDMPVVYARSRVVALGSRAAREGDPAEGAPLELLEAMAQGRPVVAPREGGIAEILGGVGTTVREPTAVAYADALEPYLLDRERAAAAGAAGRARVEDRFTIDRMVADLEATYLSVIGDRSSAVSE